MDEIEKKIILKLLNLTNHSVDKIQTIFQKYFQ